VNLSVFMRNLYNLDVHRSVQLDYVLSYKNHPKFIIILLRFVVIILSRVRVTVDGVWIGNWMY
jgi:hypothetical protein